MIRQLQQGWQRPRWLNYLVLPVSWLYRLLMALRFATYHLGIKSVHRAPVPIIVIGNISVGGTGKTPLVIALARHYLLQGRKPGVVARGYGGDSAYWPRLVNEGDDAREVGDESLLIAKTAKVPVVVGPSRIDSTRMLIDKCGCDLLISDDGFQHLSLARDLDIVVIDGTRQLGNRWCLPAGPLREPPSALRRAQIMIANGGGETDMTALHRLASDAGFSGRLFSSSVAAVDAYRLSDPDDRRQLATFAGSTVHAVAGLGNPGRFAALLDQYDIAHNDHFFPDHMQFANTDFAFLNSDDVVVMTEKDAVKCGALDLPANTWVLAIEASLSPECLRAIDSHVAANVKNPPFSGAA